MMRRIMLVLVLAIPTTVLIADDKMNESEGSKSDLTALFTTAKGEIVIELYPDEAPLTVLNFVNLAQRGYYDGLMFHRVIPNFMIQGGDPSGTGTGGPGYKFKNEISSKRKHDSSGILSMANSGPGTNGSQFFITHVPTPHLDGKHTVFGKVTSGQTVVDAISKGDVMKSITIKGDTTALFSTQKEQLEEWNKLLDKRKEEKAGAKSDK